MEQSIFVLFEIWWSRCFFKKVQNIVLFLNIPLLFFLQAVLVMKAFAACGTTPENVSKIIMIENQLSKKGSE